ncbi:tRNA-specific adenosine deaminase 1 [Bactrocera neohumeralis]|uniref:tRNA-specific adenosine deaminase 1 n=1 Tax=Bactrocera tryoni TaxID=59916 RepID=UPI001A9807F1|nr:tRNA-specific adenosine deaminase 1 [Bactrocera tryoni]XP_050333009.1 tRNA-specific adenosine deaminase 1 [Bactrocera neohumeralis]
MVLPSAEELADLVFKEFRRLPKTGKPATNEWTILSAILMHDTAKGISKVVAIGCGTKCVGHTKRCYQGFILNDSHAEVLARRALLRYIYYLLKRVKEHRDDSVFQWDNENVCFRLRAELSFHFVSTQTPCGDACIRNEAIEEKSTKEERNINDAPTEPKQKKRKMNNGNDEKEGYAPNGDDNVGAILQACKKDTVYTGAKLIGLTDEQDAMQQKIGAVRTKPGRGDRTQSMSCSDKLARWNVFGVQGALLDTLLAQPIYFETLNFVGGAKNEPAIRRAIYERFIDNEFKSTRFNVHKPTIRFSETVKFEYVENDNRKNPAATCISWCDIPLDLKPYEVSVNGRKQGVTRKMFGTLQAAVKISKYNLLLEYVDILRVEPKLRQKYLIDLENLENYKYCEYKKLAREYQTAWTLAKQNYFLQWIEKIPNFKSFSLKIRPLD